MPQKGGLLPTVRLACRSVGTLNARRDNTVVVRRQFAGAKTSVTM